MWPLCQDLEVAKALLEVGVVVIFMVIFVSPLWRGSRHLAVGLLFARSESASPLLSRLGLTWVRALSQFRSPGTILRLVVSIRGTFFLLLCMWLWPFLASCSSSSLLFVPAALCCRSLLLLVQFAAFHVIVFCSFICVLRFQYSCCSLILG